MSVKICSNARSHKSTIVNIFQPIDDQVPVLRDSCTVHSYSLSLLSSPGPKPLFPKPPRPNPNPVQPGSKPK